LSRSDAETPLHLWQSSTDTIFGSVMLSAAKHPGIFSALFELTNAGILRFAQNDRRWHFALRMTNNLYEEVWACQVC